MHKAGDYLLVLDGPDKGKTLQVTRVRAFATDSGYYLAGGDGLYSPPQVRLARARSGGNPCGRPCDDRSHRLIKTCDHCRGACICRHLPPA